MKLRKQIEQMSTEKDEEIERLKEEMKKPRGTYSATGLNNRSSLSNRQEISFPTDETSFEEIMEKNRNAQKKIHHFKHKLR